MSGSLKVKGSIRPEKTFRITRTHYSSPDDMLEVICDVMIRIVTVHESATGEREDS